MPCLPACCQIRTHLSECVPHRGCSGCSICNKTASVQSPSNPINEVAQIGDERSAVPSRDLQNRRSRVPKNRPGTHRCVGGGGFAQETPARELRCCWKPVCVGIYIRPSFPTTYQRL